MPPLARNRNGTDTNGHSGPNGNGNGDGNGKPDRYFSQRIPRRYFRKVIRITAEDSPNVQRWLQYRRAGLPPVESDCRIIPGILTGEEYELRRATWDKVRQCIGLDAEFWQGADLLMFPPDWLNWSESIDQLLIGRHRVAKGIGIDTAEGGDLTAMAAVDELGLIDLQYKKTPDTDTIIGEAVAFGKRHNVPAELWLFDRGGGGKQHADRLRKRGFRVKTIGFGEAPTLDFRRGMRMIEEKQENREERSAYKNMRAELYGTLREIMDPSNDRGIGKYGPANWTGFAIPRRFTLLRSELAPIPLTYDSEGKLYLLPKRKSSPNSKQPTLTEIIGHSPDCADAVVLAIHAMLKKKLRPKAGVR